MRASLTLLAWVALASVVTAGEDPPKSKKAPPPPPGIWWESSVEGALARAAREGRPLLVAINALENERANNMLAESAYRSTAWGEATRGYVALVCNPGEHPTLGESGCARYPGAQCATHQEALRWFTRRFGDAQISPQHVILEPDGDVAFRKEYYTGVVTPVLLETWLSTLAPRTAYARAGIGREAHIEALADVPAEELDGHLASWLDGRDGLAAAAVLNALDDSYDATRRLLLIRGLRHAPSAQGPVLVHAAEERVLYPGDEPAETQAWIATLFSVDRTLGVWAATRALVRMEDASARDAVLRLWADRTADDAPPGIDDLPQGERPHAYEALLLAGDARARRTQVPASWTAQRASQIRRALAVSGRVTPAEVGLAGLLGQAAPGALLDALGRAPPEEVRGHKAIVASVMTQAPYRRLRFAAALALLRAREGSGGAVLDTLRGALLDALEGPEVRAQVVRILGADPGRAPGALEAALAAHLEGGAR